jgi:general secretion pathway protein D
LTRFLTIVLGVVVAGCMSNPAFDEGRRLFETGQVEQGLAALEAASRAEPGNAQVRATLLRSRDLAIVQWLAEGDAARAANDIERAEATYRRVQRLDPPNARARSALLQLEADRRHREQLVHAEMALVRGDVAGAEARVRGVLAESPGNRDARQLARRVADRMAATAPAAAPQLGEQFRRPVSLEFREANLRQVFEIIARSHGVNFVFDKDVRPDIRVTLFVRNTSIEDVIRIILATNQMSSKVLNATSLLIYPNTPAKAKEYLELVTRSFYLGNADAKQTLNLVRTLVKTRDVYIDEKLNLLIMRDTPEAVRYAEKLVLQQDLAEPEVMLEVEVLEVSRSRLQELGLRYPDRVSFGPLGVAGGAAPAQFEFSSGQLRATVTNPAFVLNLKQQDSSTNVLANPRIRVRNREKARVHIGEKVPVITTTSTANVGVSASVNYLEVGLKLDVEPNVYLEDEIAIKVGLEVSNIIEVVDLFNTRAYRLGTRNAATTLRLRDGETQVLAGLIQDEDRRTASRLPGAGEIPILGRLFSSNNDSANKNEIVLLITPRILRNVLRPEAALAEFHSGTEAAIGAAPLTLRPVAPGGLKLSTAPTTAQAAKPGAGPLRPGGAAPAPAAPVAPAPTEVDLIWAGPAQAPIAGELSIQLGVPAGSVPRRVSADVVYDPLQLQPVTATPGEAAPTGRIAVLLEAGGDGASAIRELRFRVIAQQPGETRIGVENAAVVAGDGAVGVRAVPPLNLRIVPR